MALRLRLKFQKGLLTNSQRSDGLNRSWFLVTSHHETISDVVSHLLHTFDLCDTCPDGLLLSLDGYVLPPFETTRILRDKDLICVKKKGVKLVDVILEYRQNTALLEHNVEKEQLKNPGVQLLLSEELGKDESENEEDEDKNKQLSVLQEEVVPNVDVPVKKRKASKDIKSPKRKKQRQVVQDNDVQDAQKEHDDACLPNGDISKKSSINKQEHIPELAGEDLGIVKHKAKAKRKRQRQLLHENDEQEAQKEHDGACLQNGDLSSKEKQDHIRESAGEDIDSEKHKANANGIDENVEGTLTPSDPSNRTGQSRSTRRKKVKRQWKRSVRMSEKEQLLKKQSLEDDLKQSPEDDLKGDLGSNKDQNLDTDNQDPEQDEGSDTEDEVVAVMVRPGHFRFAAPGKEKDVEQNDEAKESFNWSGTINKRKGQKWGRENQPASKWNDYRAPCENQSASKWTNANSAPCENQSVSKCNENSAPCENHLSAKGGEFSSPTEKLSDSIQNDSATPSKICAPQEAPLENAPMDYEKLLPMTDSPVEGDVIAYRLVELTSSFCPELTEYRVGKVSWFETESNRIMLVPVPQYPFELIKSADEDDTYEELPDTSSYNEDGSLETEFHSLVDVRIVEHGEASLVSAVQHRANGTPAVQHEANGVPACTEPPEGKAPSTPAQYIRNDETGVKNSASAPEPVCSPRPESGAKDAWEEISAALSAKKAELLEDNWSKKRAPPPWSYRAARRSVLGPTLALLRAQNNPQTK